MNERVERLSDRLNPAIVKEVRQGLRRRGFWIPFALILFICFAISLGVYLYVRDHPSGLSGSDALVMYLLCVCAVQFFILPFSAFLALLRERNDAAWALLTLTGLGARRILHGKLLAYCVQAALYASATVPFLVFSYYLNGVDVLMIVAVVVLGSAWCVLLLAGAHFTGAMAFGGAVDRAVDMLTSFLTLGGLGVGAPMGFGIMYGLAKLLSDDAGSFLVGLWGWALLFAGVAMLEIELAVDFLARNNERDARGGKYLGALMTLGSAVGVLIVWGVWRI